MEILSAAAEFGSLPLRPGEETVLKGIAQRIGLKLPATVDFTKASTKALVLLHVSWLLIRCCCLAAALLLNWFDDMDVGGADAGKGSGCVRRDWGWDVAYCLFSGTLPAGEPPKRLGCGSKAGAGAVREATACIGGRHS